MFTTSDDFTPGVWATASPSNRKETAKIISQFFIIALL
jgi:hypothetical protein